MLRSFFKRLPAVAGASGWRMRAGALVVDNFFRGMAAAGRLHPMARPERHQVEVLTDLAYLDTGESEHLLDVYRPTSGPGPWPVVLYVHGGGFRILSKDTHWIMGLAFARAGFLVVNINYRLAPRHPYPAAVEDAAAACEWTLDHVAELGGDPTRLVLAGESAGANLVTALAVAMAYRRPEPFARRLFDRGIVPRAVLPYCGLFQVSDTARFARRKRLPFFVADRLVEVTHAYLPGHVDRRPETSLLADPLLVLEEHGAPARPLPPFFAPVGTRDPLLDDTRRLKQALDRLGTRCEVRYYPGEVHAFHALVFRPNARRCWQDTFSFLDEVLPADKP